MLLLDDTHNLEHICDVIKQNESELKNNESLVFNFTVCSNLRANFGETPIKIECTVPEI